MTEIWNEIKSHKLSAILYSLYFAIALAAHALKPDPDINGPVAPLIVAIPLLAGALVGWWKLRDDHILRHKTGQAILGGVLAGALSAGVCWFAMKGGILSEFVGWLRGTGFRGAEILEFLVFFAIVGAVLGLLGAALMRLVESPSVQARS